MKFFGFLSQQKPAWIAASNFISIFLFSLCAFLEMEGRSFEACLLWHVTVTARMTILYGACGSMERSFLGVPIYGKKQHGTNFNFWMLWIGMRQMGLSPTKKYPHHLLCKDQQSQNLHETGRSSEYDLKRNCYLKKMWMGFGIPVQNHIRLLESLWRKAGFETMWAMSFKSSFGFVSIAHAIPGTCCCKHCQGKQLVAPVWQAPY